MTTRATRVAVVVATLLMLMGSTAAASPTYPEKLKETLGMPCTPQCIVCHRTNEGGEGTVITPFGDAMLFEGNLGPKQPDALPDALNAVEAAGIDSDGDGVGDVEELRQGNDPNNPEQAVQCSGPEYGCGARLAPSARADRPALFLAGFVAMLLVLGMRRRRPK